ncbi:MAG: KpsF/GutQ family sugar-phosphate isomerase, partial [Proteobacteria bacterium]|nr:KpsF/GutQ family sugar-phosphate isomerase [Pseudomonadota bacterium]
MRAAMKNTNTDQHDISHGRAVIAREIEGLTALMDALGEEFARAVATLAASRGRVILTGMG